MLGQQCGEMSDVGWLVSEEEHRSDTHPSPQKGQRLCKDQDGVVSMSCPVLKC